MFSLWLTHTGLDTIVQKLDTIQLDQQHRLDAIQLDQQQQREELRHISALLAVEGPTSPSESERGATLVQHCSRKRDGLPPSDQLPLLQPAALADLRRQMAGGKENAWVALITPVLSDVVARASPGCILANSELIPWIRTAAEQTQFFQKPDLFACHRAAFVSGKRPFVNDRSAESTKLAESFRRPSESFLFGSCAWPLRDAVLCIFEAKLAIERNKDVGEIFPKVQNLLHGARAATAKCCLFDMQKLYLLEFTATGLLSLHSFEWTAPGSRAALDAFVRPAVEPVWLRVLRGVCMGLKVEVPAADAYLGQGATGLAFRAKCEEQPDDAAHYFALKITRDTSHISSLELEVLKLQEVIAHSAPLPWLQPRLPSPPSALRLVLEESDRLGAGFMFGPVGKAVWSEQPRDVRLWQEVLASLLLLHRAGLVHGDPRLPNLLRVPSRDQLVWIDFRESSAHEDDPMAAFQLDFQRCIASFYGVDASHSRMLELKQQYAKLLQDHARPAGAAADVLPTERAFATQVWSVFRPAGAASFEPKRDA